MAAVEPGPSGGAIVHLDAEEVQLIRGLVSEMETVLTARGGGDAVSERLYPSAFESAEESRAFDELVGDELQKAKLEGVTRVGTDLAAGGSVTVDLDASGTDLWLRALNDMRLAVGTRAGVTEEDMGKEPSEDDPKGASLWLIHWLAWIQDSLLQTLMKEEFDARDR